ncbi:MAG: biopolymer transport protein ExbB [Marinobacter maritimus]|jgi:biopolymer transport protein ExbB
MKLFINLICALLLLLGLTMPVQANKLDDLLQKVSTEQQQNSHKNMLRKDDFMGNLKHWQKKLVSAQARLNLAQSQATEKGVLFDVNEKTLTALETKLALSKGNLGELFGVVRQISGEFADSIKGSVISAQYPQREVFIDGFAERKALPSISELEQLWFIMQQEMTASSQVAIFNTKVLDAAGVASEQEVTRVGAFNLIADKQYMVINPESKLLQPLSRPVPSNVQHTLNNWLDNSAPVNPFYFDPAKGDLLTILSQTPTWFERIKQGGSIGYLIIGILLFGLLIAAVRFITLGKESIKIKQQLKQLEANPNNALGRLFAIYQTNKNQTSEVLELKLEEAVLREVPRLERGSSVLKILAAIAPMMGLLGTVTGMIGTFQAITLFGTGDPKLMAGGISMALISTVMGLVAALPLLLIHSLLHSRAGSLINIIELQSAGLIAQQAEAEVNQQMPGIGKDPLVAKKQLNKLETHDLVI